MPPRGDAAAHASMSGRAVAVIVLGALVAVAAAAAAGFVGASSAVAFFARGGGEARRARALELAAQSGDAGALRGLELSRRVCAESLPAAVAAATPPRAGDAGAPRLLCMVLTAWPKRDPYMRVALESWMSQCDQAAFLVSDDPNSTARPPERFITGEPYKVTDSYSNLALFPLSEARIIAINVTGGGRDCTGNNPTCWREGYLWRKVWQLYLKVYDLYIASALEEGGGGWTSVPEWFIKADDDSFLFVSHIRRHIQEQGLDPDEPHFMGRTLTHLKHKDLQGGMVSGNCLIMSRGAFKKLVEEMLVGIVERTARDKAQAEARGQEWNPNHILSPCIDRYGPAEDLATSICFGMINVTAKQVEDAEGRPKCLVMQYRDHLLSKHGLSESGEPKDWFWANLDPSHELANCCPSLDEIFHLHSFKGAERLRRMYEYHLLEQRLWEVKQEALAPLRQACAALGVHA